MVDFSLTRGGLLHVVFRRLGLLRGDGHDARRQVLALIVVGWVPLVLLAGLEELRGRPPLPWMLQLSVHARTLVAVPFLLIAGHLLEFSSRRAFQLVERGRLVADNRDLERIARGTARLRNAWWPELILLALVLGLSQTLVWTNVGPGLPSARWIASAPLSPPRLWYSLVSLPLSQFLLGRAAWHWLLWTRALWQLSHLELRLMPTHPDRAGGLAVLETPSIALGAVELALGSVLAAHWGDEILAGRVILSHLVSSFALFVLLAELVALGPTLLFFGHLVRTRQQGLHSYGEFALHYTRAFHAKWIDPGIDSRPPPARTAAEQLPPGIDSRSPPESKPGQQSAPGIDSRGRASELLGTSDIQSLSDLANSFDVIRTMRLVPFGRRPVTLLVVGALIPMLPLIVLEKSLADVLLAIGRIFVGGAP